ncbi:Lrp/AsnC family transcriptional regulator [Natribaculum luteum]|uniref:Lrp/AsnC family transcriptional regulator n=1 Tax=Natribaculum luteum TaxID=1586232 RepID=A0ABD5NXC6_9EURY|nr:Lrp/AsnC ligand binding domain-containing protein [Natribaculum luteum]
MVHAFVAVVVSAGTERELVEQIREHPAVTEAFVVTGDFDVIVDLETETTQELLRAVTEGIRALESVGTTRTYVCLADGGDGHGESRAT